MLQRWTAISLIDQLREGRTQPMLMECVREDQFAQKVVKAVGLPEVDQRTLLCELLGNWTARALGAITAEPCLVDIPLRLAQLLDERYRLPIAAGWAVGCEYLTHGTVWKSVKRLSESQRAEAFRLFVADMLAQNPDRRDDKPNCGFTNRGELWAYDFDLCFAHCFVPLLGESNGLEQLAQRHLLYPFLKGQAHDWQAVRDALASLERAWWDDLLYNLPDEWRSDAARIRDEVLQVVQNADNWLGQLRRWLM